VGSWKRKKMRSWEGERVGRRNLEVGMTGIGKSEGAGRNLLSSKIKQEA
jgi:hypothetical protein